MKTETEKVLAIATPIKPGLDVQFICLDNIPFNYIYLKFIIINEKLH